MAMPAMMENQYSLVSRRDAGAEDDLSRRTAAVRTSSG
jgi:hypothetical protein